MKNKFMPQGTREDLKQGILAGAVRTTTYFLPLYEETRAFVEKRAHNLTTEKGDLGAYIGSTAVKLASIVAIGAGVLFGFYLRDKNQIEKLEANTTESGKMFYGLKNSEGKLDRIVIPMNKGITTSNLVYRSGETGFAEQIEKMNTNK